MKRKSKTPFPFLRFMFSALPYPFTPIHSHIHSHKNFASKAACVQTIIKKWNSRACFHNLIPFSWVGLGGPSDISWATFALCPVVDYAFAKMKQLSMDTKNYSVWGQKIGWCKKLEARILTFLVFGHECSRWLSPWATTRLCTCLFNILAVPTPCSVTVYTPTRTHAYAVQPCAILACDNFVI